MKFYDQDLYEKEKFIRTTLTVLILFFLGFAVGCIVLCDQLQRQEQTITNQSIEINEVYKSEGEQDDRSGKNKKCIYT